MASLCQRPASSACSQLRSISHCRQFVHRMTPFRRYALCRYGAVSVLVCMALAQHGQASASSSLSVFGYECRAGEFLEPPGRCSRCLQGRYSMNGLGSSCIQCEPGRFTNVMGSTTCDQCNNAAGYLLGLCLTVVSQTISTQLRSIHVSPGTNQPVARWKYARVQCPAGSAAPTSSLCVPCGLGLQGSGSSCSQCERGRFVSTPGQSTCATWFVSLLWLSLMSHCCQRSGSLPERDSGDFLLPLPNRQVRRPVRSNRLRAVSKVTSWC